MTGPVVLLDVNVPMYAAGQEHAYKQACVWIMTEIAEGRLAVAIDTETIQEILYRYGSQQRWDVATTLATSLLGLIATVYPVDVDDARLVIDLFQTYAPRGLKARDLIHVAVMRNNGITDIISADRHFDLVDGIVRRDPQDLLRRARDSAST